MIASILFVLDDFWISFVAFDGQYQWPATTTSAPSASPAGQQQLSVHMLAISLALAKCVFNHMVEPQKKKINRQSNNKNISMWLEREEREGEESERKSDVGRGRGRRRNVSLLVLLSCAAKKTNDTINLHFLFTCLCILFLSLSLYIALSSSVIQFIWYTRRLFDTHHPASFLCSHSILC